MNVLKRVLNLHLILLVISSCAPKIDNSSGYGVFLSLCGNEVIDASEGYKIVVIDAQYLSEEEITLMQNRGQEVFSYILMIISK